MEQDELVPFVGWGVAGVPVVGTFFQAVFALAGVEARSLPVIGGVVNAFISMAVFREAAVLFKESTAMVLVLFVLIALAWVGQGIAMGVYRHRDATFACAGLVSVLFLALFFGVYSPLFAADVGVVGLVVFAGTPFVASVGALGGAWLRDWDVELQAETASALSAAASELETSREAFESGFRRRIGEETLETLAEYVPEPVASARSALEDERAVYDELEGELESVRAANVEPAMRRQRALEVKERIEERDPAAALDRIERELEGSVLDVVDRGDVEISVRSRYGRTYELVNLPSTFRELELGPDRQSTHVNDVGRAIRSVTDREDADLEAVVDALSTVETHRERIERHVSEVEESFHETMVAAEDDVEQTREELERLEGAVRERVEALLLEGVDESYESAHTVEELLRDARESLHACQFDDAERAVSEARATADGLVTTVQFFGSVAGALDHGQERLSLPDEVSREVAVAVAPAFEREYGVEYAVVDGAIVVEGRAERSRSSRDRESTRDSTTETTDEGSRSAYVDMEAVVDEVLLLFEELEDVAETGSASVHLESEELPGYVATGDALAALETFANRHSDLVASADAPEGPPGIVDLQFVEDVGAAAALRTLRERFKSEYA